MVSTRAVFDCTLTVTRLLQSKSNDIADGLALIDSLKVQVQNIRDEIDIKHDEWYLVVDKETGLM